MRHVRPNQDQGSRLIHHCVLPGAAMLAVALLVSAQPAPVNGSRPRLVVLLMVDQMRRDYIDQYGAHWTGGLRRLVDQGAWFRRASYPYLNTVTCPGHATVSTGTFPSSHGLVLNEWFDRGTGQVVGCTEDDRAALVSYGQPAHGGNSPSRLKRATLSDELRTFSPVPPHIVALSLKQRTAITLAGHQADAVVWFDDDSHAWVTSAAYAARPVGFVQKFVDAHPVAADFRRTWTRLLPPAVYRHQDAGLGESPPAPWTAQFPHRLEGYATGPDTAFYEAWKGSPYSDSYLERLAEAAVDHLKLGQEDRIDLLAVSFSALDLVGHDFGPRSHEVQDVLLRLDGTIGTLLRALDSKVGRDRYVVALSADHGAALIPEQLKADGIDAGRIVIDRLREKIEQVLKPLGSGPHVADLLETDLYLASGVYEQVRADAVLLAAVTGSIRSTPGVADVFTADQLADRAWAPSANLRMARLSYDRERSGDLVIVPRPHWFFVEDDGRVPPGSATTHGTSNSYDVRVPVILMGRGIKAGQYWQRSTPADIAPTLAALCGFTMRNVDGRVLSEALAASTTAPAGR